MLSVQTLVGRCAPAAIAVLIAGMLAAGCSTVASDDSLGGSTGTLAGAVRSDRGTPASGVQVWIWCDESAQGSSQEYTVTTDSSGSFTIEDVELGTVHAFSRTYEICANCTPYAANSIDPQYGTYTGTVSVQKDGGTSVDVEIEWIEPGPPEPAQYYDDAN